MNSSSSGSLNPQQRVVDYLEAGVSGGGHGDRPAVDELCLSSPRVRPPVYSHPDGLESFRLPGERNAIMISFSEWQDASEFASFHGLAVPVYATSTGLAEKAARRFGVSAVPTIAVLGSGGRLRAIAGPNYEVYELEGRAGCNLPTAP
jgi:hypothetical protein